jgi:hypothetical protein
MRGLEFIFACRTRAAFPAVVMGMFTRSGRNGPMRRYTRHFFDTGSNTSGICSGSSRVTPSASQLLVIE